MTPGLLRWAVEAGLPLPRCGFRLATGLPCPACGSTRALLALTAGEPVAAWRLNPLATVLISCLALAGGIRITERVLGTNLWGRLGSMAGVSQPHTVRQACLPLGHVNTPAWRPTRRAWLFWSLILLLIANWLYLLSQ